MAGSELNIWYINHYAGFPGTVQHTRPQALAEHWSRAGHRPTIFFASNHHMRHGPHRDEPCRDEAGIRFVALPAPAYSGNGVGRLLNIGGFVRSVNRLSGSDGADHSTPDAIIVSSPHPFAIYPAARLARRHQAVLVFETRDLWPLSITEITRMSKLHPFVVLCAHAERFACRNADLVASLLGGAEPHFRDRGLPPGRFLHVPNGIEADTPVVDPPVTAHGRRAAGQIDAWRSEGRVILIHPGAQGEPNALDRLLGAIAALDTATASRLGVLLVGHGSETAKLRAAVDALERGGVLMVEPVPKQEALWLTRNSDIGYAGARDRPGLYRYGISFNKILDFMAAGLPIILPLKAEHDPVSASGCGLKTRSDQPADIADAIVELIEAGPEVRKAMGDRGRAYARQHLTYDIISRHYAAALEEILARRRPGGAEK